MSKKFSSTSTREFEEKIGAFVSSLEIPFRNISPYCLAFVHRSVLNERIIEANESNERLEFLGDAVLELAITERLFNEFPDKQEGVLTDIRSALVRGKNLADIALRIGLGEHILLSKGETLAGGNSNPYILANTFEAFLGAIYLDLGYVSARAFVEQHVFSTLDAILDKKLHVDPKSALQELSQARWSITPSYELVRESGADHSKTYTMSATIGGVSVGEWSGSSKKKAEQEAAENALSRLTVWKKTIKA